MILIVDMCYRKDSLLSLEFVRPIADIVRQSGEYDIRHYTDISEDVVSGFDKVILCGTALADNAYLEHMDKLMWIRDTYVPVLGICAGMQAIGLAFGAQVTKNGFIGMRKISTVIANPLFSGDFSAYELHNYSVSAPDGFKMIAKASGAPACVEAFMHPKKKIYGVMFHPEVRNKDIVKRFVESQA